MKIHPFQGLNGFLFGMSQADVRKKIADSPVVVLDTPENNLCFDAYDKMGVHFHYDSKGFLEFVETFKPCIAEYDGMKLIEMSPESVLNYFEEKGFVINKEDNAGFDIPELGITIYVPLDDIETVGVFRRGYFDE